MASSARARTQIQSEILERFGTTPSFLIPALATPDVLESCWNQTCTAFLDNPLPTAAKAILCVWLLGRTATGRDLAVAYCHGLRPLPLSEKSLESWLMTPWPKKGELASVCDSLEAASPRADWPEPDDVIGPLSLRAAALLFLYPTAAERLRAALRRLYGMQTLNQMLALLAFFSACLIWMQQLDADPAEASLPPPADLPERQAEDPPTPSQGSGIAAPVAIVDRQGMIVSANPEWRAFSDPAAPYAGGFAPGTDYLTACEQASGQGALEARAIAAAIRRVFADGATISTLEYPGVDPQQPRWFLLRILRLPEDEPRVLVSHEEITAQHREQEELRDRVQALAETTLQLERKNQELDHFAYITSHDLKAPLRGIANLSRWIEEDLGGEIQPEVLAHLQLLRGRVSRMESMIEGILQYARIGRVKINAECVDVGALLRQVIDLLDPPESFQIELDSAMPTVTAQRVRLEQVFLNLIGNALKHHHRTDGRIQVTVADAGSHWEFAVCDDGPGIAPQYHEKVFQMFQTLEARDRVENTGVGLALVKKIVESQGGTVTLDSEAGGGSTFRFTWPKQ